MTILPCPRHVLKDLWISALAASVSESCTPAAQNVTVAAAKHARGPCRCPRCHINRLFKGMKHGGTTVTANSPSSSLFTRLRCAKSRFCSRGRRREHPDTFQTRAQPAAMSQSPLRRLRSLFPLKLMRKKTIRERQTTPPAACKARRTGEMLKAFGNPTRHQGLPRQTGPGHGCRGCRHHRPLPSSFCGSVQTQALYRQNQQAGCEPCSFRSLTGE